MNSMSKEQFRELVSGLPENLQKMVAESIVSKFLGGVSPSVKEAEPEYSARPVLPNSMSDVVEKSFGASPSSTPAVKSSSSRFCPSWFQKGLRNNHIAIHKPTGAIFRLMNEEKNMGGWKFDGWAVDSYGGIVNTEWRVPGNLMSAISKVDSLGGYVKLIDNGMTKKGTPRRGKFKGSATPCDWYIPSLNKTLGQICYSCKRKHKQGII